jgi:hypothetical protein
MTSGYLETVIVVLSLVEKMAPLLIGVITGWWLKERSDSQRWKREKESEKKAFCSALVCEIEGIRERYMEAIGSELQKVAPGDFLRRAVVIKENYFTVFEANAAKIGLLKPDDSKQVVTFYIAAKGQADSLRTYKMLLDEVSSQAAASTQGPALRAYTEQLKNAQKDLIHLADLATSALRNS